LLAADRSSAYVCVYMCLRVWSKDLGRSGPNLKPGTVLVYATNGLGQPLTRYGGGKRQIEREARECVRERERRRRGGVERGACERERER